MPILLALAAVAAPVPIDRQEAMERCAERVIALRHPNMGMADLTDTKFEWLQVSGTGTPWVIIGSITEPTKSGRVARRFTCRVEGEGRPSVAFGRVIRLPR
jgi:hypothetical protein